MKFDNSSVSQTFFINWRAIREWQEAAHLGNNSKSLFQLLIFFLFEAI